MTIVTVVLVLEVFDGWHTSCLLLFNKLPQNLVAKNNIFIYLTVSVSQESGHGLAGAF